jgi:hypothetical protein
VKKIARQAASVDAAAQDDAAATALSSPHAFSKAIDPQNGGDIIVGDPDAIDRMVVR